MRSEQSAFRFPWYSVTILAAAGSFHFYRGALVEGVVFWLAALALAADAVGALPKVHARSVSDRNFRAASPMALSATALAAVLVAVLVVGWSPLHGTLDAIVIAAAGVVVAWIVWPQRAESGPTRTTAALRRSTLCWSTAAVATCLFELVIYFLGDVRGLDRQFPTLSDLISPAFGNHWVRTAMAALWLSGGFVLVGSHRRGKNSSGHTENVASR
jgi:hypothetical protein